MSEYKAIKGFKVETVSTDPAASLIATGTWASGGTANTARWDVAGAGTTQNAALAFGGGTPGDTGATESYNGSNWTSVTSMNTARRLHGGSGSQTAALAAAGYNGTNVANVELYNGSTWTEVNDVNSARRYPVLAVQGTNSANLLIGGRDPGGTSVAYTESWNGTSWTEVNDLNTARFGVAGFGTQTAALAASGDNNSTAVESWNGTSWTEVTEINSVRYSAGNAGSQTAALMFGGDTPAPIKTGETEYWNGSSWTELNDMSTGRSTVASAGTATDALAGLGNSSGAVSAVTEVWTTAPALTFQKINLGQVFYNSTSNAFKVTKDNSGVPLGTWSSGATIPGAGAYDWGSSGTQSAFLAIGGYASPGQQNVLYLYNGTAWSTPGVVLNTARYGNRGVGTQTDALQVGGYNTPGSAYTGATELYNGSSWTELNDLNTARGYGTFFGTTSAAIYATGSTPSTTTAAESWNGSSWTATTSTNIARNAAGGVGTTSTAGLVFGGNTNIANTESWNGSAWTELNDLNTGRRLAGSGSQTLALGYAGYIQPSSSSANTEYWDGSTWTEVADLGTARYGITSTPSGTTFAAIAAGGENPPAGYTLAEEWNAPAPFATNNTLTVS